MTLFQQARHNSIEHQGETWFRRNDFCALRGIKPSAISEDRKRPKPNYKTMQLFPYGPVYVSWTAFTAKAKIKAPRGSSRTHQIVTEITSRKPLLHLREAADVMAEQRQEMRTR